MSLRAFIDDLNKKCPNIQFRDGIPWKESDFEVNGSLIHVLPYRGCDPDDSSIVCSECAKLLRIHTLVRDMSYLSV